MHVSMPTEEEKTWLRETFRIAESYIEDALDEDERPRVERREEFVFILVRCSRSDAEETIPFVTIPLGIFVHSTVLVTVCARDPDVIADVVESGAGGISTDRRTTLLLHILLRNSKIFGRHLRRIHEQSTLGEEELERSLTGGTMIRILNHGKSLIYFSSSLASNQAMLTRLQKSNFLELAPGDPDLMEDILYQNIENVETAEVFSRIHTGMMDAFSSLVSVNLNVLVRILTEITIALSIPMIIVGLWGMNVSLPHAGNPFAFWIILSLLTILAVATFVVIRLGEVVTPQGVRRR